MNNIKVISKQVASLYNSICGHLLGFPPLFHRQRSRHQVSFFIKLVKLLPPLLISVTTIIFFTKSRSANPLTPEQRIMAMREKSQMALAQIVKLTAGESSNFFKLTVVQINWTVNS